MEEQAVWNILGWRITPYAGSIWIACAAALAVFFWQGRKLKLPARIWTAALGVALGLFCARLYYVLARLELFLDVGLENFFRTAEEDYRAWGSVNGAAFWGAVGGVALAALAAGKITREKVSAILDALAPSAALGIAISRFGEYSIGEGIGPEAPEGFQFFPLAVMNEWEEWYFALFLLEGLVGLVIFVLLLTVGAKYRSGGRARMFLILYAACQIVLEALRRDSFLRWLFVRVSQVASAVVLLGVVVFALARWLRSRGAEERRAGRLAGKILLDLVLVLVPLGAVLVLYRLLVLGQPMDVSASSLWWKLLCGGWPVTLAAMAGLCVWGLLQKRGPDGLNEKQAAMCAAAFLVPALVIVAMEFGIDKSADLPEEIGYLTEAACSACMGINAWKLAMPGRDGADSPGRGIRRA